MYIFVNFNETGKKKEKYAHIQDREMSNNEEVILTKDRG